MKPIIITIISIILSAIALPAQTTELQMPATTTLFDTCDCNIYTAPYSLTENCPNSKLLIQNTGVFLGGAIGVVGVLYLMPETVTSWNKKSFTFDNVFGKWSDNVAAGPVLDGDNWTMNWVAHPYFGAVYYTSARNIGYNALNSLLYSTAMSTFMWEYGFEAFAEVPSVQDIIITPLVGAALGELFFLAKKEIVKNDYLLLNSRILGHIVAFLLDPINEFNSLIFPKSYSYLLENQKIGS